jgi:2-C-methyl-D-erythritol 4-phosphate cytidylyltransferase
MLLTLALTLTLTLAMASAIIVAAGSSQRMGFDKLTASLCGKPIVIRSLDRFEECDLIDDIVLVVRSDRREEFQQMIRKFGLKKVRCLVDGGKERHLSVWNGLQQLPPETRIVAVHDAARPMVSSELIGQAVQMAEKCGAVSVAAPIVETLKKADTNQEVVASIDREGVWGMQTPQVFRFDWLLDAYQRIVGAGQSVTDEVSAMQAAGHNVRLLPNPDWNIKITFQRDLDLAEKLMQE